MPAGGLAANDWGDASLGAISNGVGWSVAEEEQALVGAQGTVGGSTFAMEPRPAYALEPRPAMAGAAAPAAVRRLDQRLEAVRRHLDRQVKRLERRLEEVACASAAGGRWAELQGYVDGLAETVQGLIRHADDSASSSPQRRAASTPLAGSAAAAALQSALGVSQEDAQPHAGAGAGSDHTVELRARLLEFGTRLHSVERGLEGLSDLRSDLRAEVKALTSLVASGDHGNVPAVSGGKDDRDVIGGNMASVAMEHRVQKALLASGIHDHLSGMHEANEEFGSRLSRVEQGLEAAAPLQDLGHMQDEVAELAARLAALERGECAAGGGDYGPYQNYGGQELEGGGPGRDPAAPEEMLAPLAELGDQVGLLQDQVAELAARMQDAEQGLQDATRAEEVRQQVTHVSEQLLRLKTQRVSRGSGLADDDARELRRELSDMGEELSGLWTRVDGAERGLEGMAEALGRVCEEFAAFRERVATAASDDDLGASLSNIGDNTAATIAAAQPALSTTQSTQREAEEEDEEGEEKETDDSASELRPSHKHSAPPRWARAHGDQLAARGGEHVANGAGKNGQASSPLRQKVLEVERGLESMAEVVWDMKKQISGLRLRTSAG